MDRMTTTTTTPTARETEALALFESGKSAAEVAEAMTIKEGHAYNLRNNALRKLGRGSEVGSSGGSGTRRVRVDRFKGLDPLAVTMVKSHDDVTESIRRAEARVESAKRSVTEAEENLSTVTAETETVLAGLDKGAKAMKVDLAAALATVAANVAEAEAASEGDTPEGDDDTPAAEEEGS